MKRSLSRLEEFLTADGDAQFELLKDSNVAAQVRSWMGELAFSELQRFIPDSRHLGAGIKNLVFVPGVMGSTLQSNGLGGVWWLDMVRARDKLNELCLTDDGQGDIDEDAEISPGAVDLSYIPFRKAVATSNTFGGSVHFPYDWRKSLTNSADALRDAILKTYTDYEKPVHLVGHSMGGLMIRTALRLHGDVLWKKIGRIVFIGTPHYGSPAIAGYLKNHLWGWEEIAVLAMFLSRDTFRSLRGVLSLLPAPAGIYPGSNKSKVEEHPCANFDMYNAESWELNLDAGATKRLQNILDEVKQHYADLSEWHSSLPPDKKNRMLMIAGVGQETLFRLEFDSKFWGVWKYTNKVTSRIPCDPNRDGDARVPLASALLEDVQTRYVQGVHGALPNIPSVIQDVLAWLTERKLELPETCKGGLGGHLSATEGSSAPLLDGSDIGSRYRELPQYENPSPEFRAEIERKLDAGQMKSINLIKIL